MELDPNKKSPKDAGAKLDAGKIRPHLVMNGFAKALKEVSLVGTIGASKYSDNGWITVPKGIERYTEAMLRHYLEESDGVLYDPDLTKRAGKPVHHAACIAWNALARLELILQEEKSNETRKTQPVPSYPALS